MARQTGVLRYSGNLGGISHYKMKGVQGDLARLANGPSKEQIENDPAFIRTRENNMEFGGSAKAAKSFREGLASVLRTYADSQVAGRLTRVFKSINKEGAGARGRREIALSLHRELLTGFEFNTGTAFSSVFGASYSFVASADRLATEMNISPFNPIDSIDIPPGATHFRVLSGITVVSDARYDTDANEYKLAQPELSGINDIQYSTYLPVDQAITADVTIAANLPGTPTLTADVSVVGVVGVEFYQEVSGDYYVFASGNAMKVDSIF